MACSGGQRNLLPRAAPTGLRARTSLTPSRLQSRSIDRIASTAKTDLMDRLQANTDKGSTRLGLRIGADLDESGVDSDKESQHENSREDHTFGGFGCTTGGPCRRAAALAERVAAH